MERFARLNSCGFHPMKFSWENFCGALLLNFLNNVIIRSSYIFTEKLCSTLEKQNTKLWPSTYIWQGVQKSATWVQTILTFFTFACHNFILIQQNVYYTNAKFNGHYSVIYRNGMLELTIIILFCVGGSMTKTILYLPQNVKCAVQKYSTVVNKYSTVALIRLR